MSQNERITFEIERFVVCAMDEELPGMVVEAWRGIQNEVGVRVRHRSQRVCSFHFCSRWKKKKKNLSGMWCWKRNSSFSFENLNVFLLIVGRDRQTTHFVATIRNSIFIFWRLVKFWWIAANWLFKQHKNVTLLQISFSFVWWSSPAQHLLRTEQILQVQIVWCF